MTVARPIFRIFDYAKVIEFYVEWLGFKIDWEHKPDNSPIYMQISLGDIIIHLSEHHGDCSPAPAAEAQAVRHFAEQQLAWLNL